jgi:ABC-type lipopolysaccharide export system ATPase subunit
MLTRVRLKYKQEMVLQMSHKKKEKGMVRKKKDMVTHTLRVQLTREKLMKNYSGGLKWRPMGMNVDWNRTPQMMRMARQFQGIETVTISHSYLSMLVRMWPGSIEKM